jgi:aminopeptidase-like protein
LSAQRAGVRWSAQTYLETLDGRRIFSDAEHPLHVVSYSRPFGREASREELLRHLHVPPTLPDAVSLVFQCYERDWGLCCSRSTRDALRDERYRRTVDELRRCGVVLE